MTGPTRRDFVAMLLGAPVAAALACRRGPRGLPPGTLIETGRRRGHAALRAGGRDAAAVPAVDASRWRRARVAIVGAGAAGLGAAWFLRRAGVDDVVVLELDDVIGGTARGDDGPVTPAPWGAHYIVAPQAHQAELVALFADLDAIEGWTADGAPIVAEALRCRDPEERLFYRGRWYPGLYLAAGASADDHAQRERFEAEIARWAAWRAPDGARAFTLPVSACAAAPELAALDTTSFAAWLDAHGLTSPRLRWLCDYACRDDYGLEAAGTSAWAGLFYFAARMAAPGAESQPVVTWPDGNRALIRALARGVTVETGVAVVDVRAAATGGGAELVAIGPDGVFGVRADRAIVAAPRHVARRIVAPLRGVDERPIDTAPWAVANLHLRARPRERPGAAPAWDNVLRDSPSLGYVSATHQAGRDTGPTVWTWYYPFTDLDAASVRRRLDGAGRDEWAEVALADLERAHPDLRSLVDRIDVAFWGHGMPRPTVGFRAALPSHAPLGPIHLAHTDLSGLALFEEAFDHGTRAAREALAALGARG
jgi:phytoene dehydrogenase-like protein